MHGYGNVHNTASGISKFQVVRDIHRLVSGGAEFVDGQIEEYESIILATGYRTNITSWLKVH